MRALTGLLLGYAILVCGNSMLTTLLSLRLLAGTHSPIVVGIVQSCYYVGCLLGALGIGALVIRIGPHRAFIGFGALAALAALGDLSCDDPLLWAVLRIVTGLSMIGIFTSLESGVNGAVANGRRGRAFAIYLVLTYLGVSAGQFLLGAGHVVGDGQQMLVHALFIGAPIPVALLGNWSAAQIHTGTVGATHEVIAPTTSMAMTSLSASPGVIVIKTTGPLSPPALLRRFTAQLDGLREIRRVAPHSLPACIGAGSLSGAFYALAPVFLARIGFTSTDISRTMGVALTGALLLQWPVGKLSDRYERPTVIGIVSTLSAVVSALLIVTRSQPLVEMLLFAYVSLTFTLYGVIVSDVNDRVDANRRVKTSAALLLAFSIGGVAGPLLSSLCVLALGEGGLYAFALVVTLALSWLSHTRR
jgi:MFS family permease